MTRRARAGDGAGLASDLVAAGFRGDTRPAEPLAAHTTWRIGGPAELLAAPRDADDVRCALLWAASRGVAVHVLGNGSNLLVRDEGVRGLVLHVQRALDETRFEGPRLRAGAGASFPALARLAAARGLSGLEFAGGIPGTLGGALRMNAGWHEHEIGPLVRWVELVGPGASTRRLQGRECGFDYRRSRFAELRGAIVEAELELRPDDRAAIRERMRGYLESRKAHQPTELPSCGSVFLKPPGDFAGRLIEAAGLKGLRRGDVQVSPKHANFFVNLGRATAADVLALVEEVESRVLAHAGVRLEREFEVW